MVRFTVLLASVAAMATQTEAQERHREVSSGQPMLQAERPEPTRVDLPEVGVAVAMQHQLHLPVILATVNGEGPYRFGIDTGASLQLSVSDDLVEKLELSAVGEVTASDGTGRNSGQRKIYEVVSLRIGDATFHDLRGMSGNYNRGQLATEPIDGIIGIGLFNGLTLTLDYLDKGVRISRDALPEPDEREIFAMHAAEPVPTIDWNLGGKTVRTHVDARNMGALLAPKSLADQLPLDGEPIKVGEARTQFNSISIEAASYDGDLKLGRHVINAPMITFAEVFRAAIIGSRLMEQFEVTIDQRNNRIRFHRDGNEKITLARPPARKATGAKDGGR